MDTRPTRPAGAATELGLEHTGPARPEVADGPRGGAAALPLKPTSGGMVVLRSPHPPSGATTLIISLGILTDPVQIVVLMVAVLLLTGQAFIITRLASLPYPAWSHPAETPTPHPCRCG